ncbi:MAG: EamA family transporter [Chitinophagaceae bacterium]
MPAWMIYALLSAFFAALTAVFAKAGLKNINADLATGVRTVFILIITWVIIFTNRQQSGLAGLSKNNWLFLVLSAFATGLSWLFYYRALQVGKVSQVTVIDKGSIVFTIFLSVIFLKEPLTLRLALGALLIFSGMLIVIWK